MMTEEFENNEHDNTENNNVDNIENQLEDTIANEMAFEFAKTMLYGDPHSKELITIAQRYGLTEKQAVLMIMEFSTVNTDNEQE